MKTEENKQNPDSLKTQSAWLLFAKIIGFGFSFLLPLMIVRFLSQDKVGLYREAFQVIVDAATLLPLGFSMSAYYFLGRNAARHSAAIFNILLFNLVIGGLACLTLFIYPQIIGNIFQSEELTRLTPKIGIVIWLWIFSTFLETVAVANQESRLATAFIILAQFSKTFLMVLAVILFASVESFLYAAMIQGALQTVVLLVYLNSRFPRFWAEFYPKFFAEQAIYALPFGLAAALWMLQTQAHNYFVGHKFSEADFAVYAYGCFQLPLIAMLAESVASVLIPRMSELEAKNDTREIIRLTARAMQKLSFFYFPLYIFLMITAQTFIITLFTRNYLASAPIFMINLTILPFSILLTDPIVRAYKEFARFLLVLRFFVVAVMIAVLYFGIQYFDMRGMIAVATISLLAEKTIAEVFIIRRLKFGRKDFHLLKNVGKTAVAAIIAGAVTFAFYTLTKDRLFEFGEQLAADIFQTSKITILNFVGGSLTLCVTAFVFALIYLLGAYHWGIIEDEEKQTLKNVIFRVSSFVKNRFNSKSPTTDNRRPTTDH